MLYSPTDVKREFSELVAAWMVVICPGCSELIEPHSVCPFVVGAPPPNTSLCVYVCLCMRSDQEAQAGLEIDWVAAAYPPNLFRSHPLLSPTPLTSPPSHVTLS